MIRVFFTVTITRFSLTQRMHWNESHLEVFEFPSKVDKEIDLRTDLKEVDLEKIKDLEKKLTYYRRKARKLGIKSRSFSG